MLRAAGDCDALRSQDSHVAACRSEEHTSELQSLMRISYAVFCLKKKKSLKHHTQIDLHMTHSQTLTFTLNQTRISPISQHTSRYHMTILPTQTKAFTLHSQNH